MDFSKATDYELVKELARRVDEYSLNGRFNVYPHEHEYDGKKQITFYVDDGEDCACDVEFSFDEAGNLEDCFNDRNPNVEEQIEQIEQFIQDNAGKYYLLELAHRALEAYGIY